MEERNFISLGLGVQSTALYYMSSMGELPAIDAAIFVDLGREKRKTYQYLDFLQEWRVKNNGLPLIIVRKKNLYQDLLNQENSTGQRFAAIPAYTKGEGGKAGMLRRQCTNEYKISQVDTAMRESLEVESLRGYKIRVWKGISSDEWDRMNNPEQLWKIHVYPFTGYEVDRDNSIRLPNGQCQVMSRNAIIAWYRDHSLPIPPKSSCVFCPYQSEFSWAAMKREEPEDFEAACLVDEALRDSTKKGITQPVYLHQSLKPLRLIQFPSEASDIWAGECSGECHT